MKNKKGNQGFMAIKYDMERAYDQIEWPFLLKIMECLGFDRFWCGWIYECISSPIFSVLIKNRPSGLIKPKRGLRQGDPLSPFLFILCTEAISRLIANKMDYGALNGIKPCNSAPSISHLLFADDLIVFGHASCLEAEEIMAIMEEFGGWSGQRINIGKSSVHFSGNTLPEVANQISQVLHVRKAASTLKYLGLPLVFDRARTKSFGDILNRVSKRLGGWKSKVLSQAARGVLIRTVVQAMPSYVMSSFQIPKTLCSKLDSLMRRFWWGFKDNQRGLCLKAWESMCLPKSEGGLGFRKMEDMNLSLIAKLGWAVVYDEDRLWVTLIKRKYLKGIPFLRFEKKSNTNSIIWQGILSCKPIIKVGACMLVGHGIGINVWDDPWIPWLEHFKPIPLVADVRPKLQVADFLDESLSVWNHASLLRTFDGPSCEAIGKIKPLLSKEENPFVWVLNSKGNFSVKSAYLAKICDKPRPTHVFCKADWLALWAAHIHPRHKIFLWKIAWNCIPVRAVLAVRFHVEDTSCPLCGYGIETLSHLFLECSLARILWRSSVWQFSCDRLASLGMTNALKLLFSSSNELHIPLDLHLKFLIYASVTMEQIWRARNMMVHQNCVPNIELIRSRIVALADEHYHAQTKPIKVLVSAKEWGVPPAGWIKANFDIAFRSNICLGACIFRNEFGKIIHAKSWRLSEANPTAAEAATALLSVTEAAARNFPKVVFEGDSLLAINPLSSLDAVPEWCTRAITQETRRFLFSCNFSWSFAKVPRACNGLAHRLVQWAATALVFGDIVPISIPPSVVDEGNSG